ncbi:MAG: hypothetical protein CMA68_03620 [Euryarchaeota archaeon]|nr:hypothetical protein [Euryarchaeota archaeon]
MTILGTGNANGGVSILHALGLGRGCSIAIDLTTTVNIHDEPMDVQDDYHGLLDAVLHCWRKRGLPTPNTLGWEVISDVPIGQGLKSSSALACAALRALNQSSWAGLSDSEIVDIAVESQVKCGCSVTGSMDDSWAAMGPGWKLVDPRLPASESVLFEGEVDDELSVLIIPRGIRESEIDANSFSQNSHLFERSLASLTNGSFLDALSSNGMAVASSTDDFEALRTCNLAIASGALAAGLSGSGPAIAVVCYAADVGNVRNRMEENGLQVIKTSFATSEIPKEEVR